MDEDITSEEFESTEAQNITQAEYYQSETRTRPHKCQRIPWCSKWRLKFFHLFSYISFFPITYKNLFGMKRVFRSAEQSFLNSTETNIIPVHK